MWDYLYSYYYQLVSIVFLISVDFGGKGSYRGLLVIEFPGWAISMVGNYFPKLESALSLALPKNNTIHKFLGLELTIQILNFQKWNIPYFLI